MKPPDALLLKALHEKNKLDCGDSAASALSDEQLMARRDVLFPPGAASLHQCNFNSCRFITLSRSAIAGGAASSASASAVSNDADDWVICALYGVAHHCTDRDCDASDETPHGHVCRVTRRTRRVIFHYTLGAARGHLSSGDSGHLHRPTIHVKPSSGAPVPMPASPLAPIPRPYSSSSSSAAEAAMATVTTTTTTTSTSTTMAAAAAATTTETTHEKSVIEKRRRLLARVPTLSEMFSYRRSEAPAPGASAAVVSFVAAPSEQRALAKRRSLASLEHAYGSNLDSKFQDARRIVFALVGSDSARDRAEARRQTDLEAADAAAVYALSVKGATLCNAVATFVSALSDSAAFAIEGRRPLQWAPHIYDEYARVCTTTWARMCRSPAARDIDARQHPSFRKHCIGTLYRMATGGFRVRVCVDSADFGDNTAVASRFRNAIFHDVTFLERDARLAEALPAYGDLDAVIAECDLSCDKSYTRDGANMLRSCYSSIIDVLRITLRRALNEAQTIDAAKYAVRAFFAEVMLLEFSRVVGIGTSSGSRGVGDGVDASYVSLSSLRSPMLAPAPSPVVGGRVPPPPSSTT